MVDLAALYVQNNGAYFGIDGIDPWDEDRDARVYSGPHPVIAHPPCQRWGKMFAGNPSVIARTGVRKIKGDDGGCFAAGLDSVRRYGGVLEHPWGSHAWAHFNLSKPPREGGWVAADMPGPYNGWTCCVEQGRYGHYAPKQTLLYAVGCDLPELEWGVYKVKDEDFPEWARERYGIKKCRRIGLLSFKGGGTDSTPRIATPEPFKEILIEMARSVSRSQEENTND
jgi:hypothetical protein